MNASSHAVFGIPLVPMGMSAARLLRRASSYDKPTESPNMLGENVQLQFGDRVREVLAKINIERLPLNVRNYKDETIGRLTVVAYSHSRLARSGPVRYWVVRCTCGKHEMRTDRCLRKEASPQSMCRTCANFEIFKQNQRQGGSQG